VIVKMAKIRPNDEGGRIFLDESEVGELLEWCAGEMKAMTNEEMWRESNRRNFPSRFLKEKEAGDDLWRDAIPSKTAIAEKVSAVTTDDRRNVRKKKELINL
jgi:hypothetical protein